MRKLILFLTGYHDGNTSGSEPGEVKHLSTRRKREQYELRSVLTKFISNGWNATLVIPLVAASEKGEAQTGT